MATARARSSAVGLELLAEELRDAALTHDQSLLQQVPPGGASASAASYCAMAGSRFAGLEEPARGFGVGPEREAWKSRRRQASRGRDGALDLVGRGSVVARQGLGLRPEQQRAGVVGVAFGERGDRGRASPPVFAAPLRRARAWAARAVSPRPRRGSRPRRPGSRRRPPLPPRSRATGPDDPAASTPG